MTFTLNKLKIDCCIQAMKRGLRGVTQREQPKISISESVTLLTIVAFVGVVKSKFMAI